jgi:hypothetical protein
MNEEDKEYIEKHARRMSRTDAEYKDLFIILSIVFNLGAKQGMNDLIESI